MKSKNPFLPDLGAALTLGAGFSGGSVIANKIMKKVWKNPTASQRVYWKKYRQKGRATLHRTREYGPRVIVKFDNGEERAFNLYEFKNEFQAANPFTARTILDILKNPSMHNGHNKYSGEYIKVPKHATEFSQKHETGGSHKHKDELKHLQSRYNPVRRHKMNNPRKMSALSLAPAPSKGSGLRHTLGVIGFIGVIGGGLYLAYYLTYGPPKLVTNRVGSLILPAKTSENMASVTEIEPKQAFENTNLIEPTEWKWMSKSNFY